MTDDHLTDDHIQCWKINYGLDKRTPQEAMQWWHDGNGGYGGMAPAGAVAALGLCLLEIERLRAQGKPS